MQLFDARRCSLDTATIFLYLPRGRKGKTIKPFCTHEGSGMGSSLHDIKRLCPDAKVEKGLAICGGSVRQAKQEISEWI